MRGLDDTGLMEHVKQMKGVPPAYGYVRCLLYRLHRIRLTVQGTDVQTQGRKGLLNLFCISFKGSVEPPVRQVDPGPRDEQKFLDAAARQERGDMLLRPRQISLPGTRRIAYQQELAVPDKVFI